MKANYLPMKANYLPMKANYFLINLKIDKKAHVSCSLANVGFLITDYLIF